MHNWCGGKEHHLLGWKTMPHRGLMLSSVSCECMEWAEGVWINTRGNTVKRREKHFRWNLSVIRDLSAVHVCGSRSFSPEMCKLCWRWQKSWYSRSSRMGDLGGISMMLLWSTLLEEWRLTGQASHCQAWGRKGRNMERNYAEYLVLWCGIDMSPGETPAHTCSSNKTVREWLGVWRTEVWGRLKSCTHK